MDGVGISIIERPRPLPGHDTPNPTEHPYTLKCEEPLIVIGFICFFPFPVPRWADARYQYMKRHGMLDELRGEGSASD